MGNYKPYATEVLLAGDMAIPLKSGETGQVLSYYTTNTTGLSLHDEFDANYIVPSGKTFKALAVLISGNSGSTRILTLLQSDAADGVVGEIVKDARIAIAKTELYWIPLMHHPTFASGKYVNQKTNNITSSAFIALVYGVEY